MERIAKFQKVSLDRWKRDIQDIFGGSISGEEAEKLWEQIRLPKRATAGSAGYDICTPVDICLKPGESMKIPTGIRAGMRQDYCLFIVPRSGLGSRYRFQLNNTTGVIDSDYFFSDNEGHIFVPMINDSREGKVLELKAGSAFVQGIFCPFGITEDDDAEGTRNGGFGSTG
ncbi:MAG: deoxyuridine 5'-triphosphate nucleotidohydrolase [Lachnospiraceae bacterium]|nr:deoxyuridine 5'-triphosphate nucleotidohydrolase [Lachnospiraceae bacterium]